MTDLAIFLCLLFVALPACFGYACAAILILSYVNERKQQAEFSAETVAANYAAMIERHREWQQFADDIRADLKNGRVVVFKRGGDGPKNAA